MAKSVEISAKTIDAAVEKGLEELGLDRDSVSVEVLETPRSGFLGIGGSNAKVRITELGGEDEAVDAPSKEAKKPAEKKKSKENKESSGSAEAFISTVLGYINNSAEVKTVGSEDGFLKLEIVGDHLGGIIGRRGETLDALQHLANLVANRESGEKTRVTLDAENYRAKRSDSLVKFAERAASQVLKYKRNKVLEPMNAYERHIVHVALQNKENIATSSVGVEPMRRVVISYTGPDAQNRRR